MIEIKNGNKAFKQNVVFQNLNLEINQPGLYMIQGKSGSGKSTLLNLLAGFDVFDSGEIDIDPNLATIFQNYELIHELTVQENIILDRRNMNEKETTLIQQLGIDEYLYDYPNEISGGQQQRVGIARALHLNPNIILCDEPTESLDIENKKIVMDLLKQLSKHKIVIVASHDPEIIEEYADVVFRIENKQLVKDGDVGFQSSFIENELIQRKNKSVFQLIHQIFKKRTMLAVVSMLILSVSLFSLYIYEKHMFYIPNTTYVVNADMLYIEGNKDVILERTDFKEQSLKPIFKFLKVRINGKDVLCQVYPYVTNDLVLDGLLPEAKKVIINQNVAELLGNWQNNSIEAFFVNETEDGGFRDQMTFEVVGMIEETDSKALSIYYDYDSLMRDAYGDDYRAFLMNKVNNFQIITSYENIKQIDEKYKTEQAITLFNPLYQQRQNFLNDSQVYQLLFNILETLIFVGINIFTWIYMLKDVKYCTRICSILASLQFNLNLIKQQYIKEKLVVSLPLLLLVFGSVMVIGLTIFHASSYLNASDYHQMILMIVCITLSYIISLLLGLVRLRKERIDQILKDSKD